MSGDIVEASVEDIVNVAELRSRLAIVCGVRPGFVQVLDGDALLDKDDTRVEALSGRELTVMLSTDWYPAGKYIHDGKDVLKITTQSAEDSRGYVEEDSCEIHYTDGSQEQTADLDCANRLIEEFGFVRHTINASFPLDDEFLLQVEAVPPEDPETWLETEIREMDWTCTISRREANVKEDCRVGCGCLERPLSQWRLVPHTII